MNQTQASLPQNPWRSPEGIPAPSLARVLLAAVALLAALLFFPLWDFLPYSYITVAACFAYAVITARSLRATLPILLAVFSLTLLSLPLGAALGALILATSAGAFLITAKKRGFLWLLLLPLAYALSVAVTQNPWVALGVLFPLPALLALAVTTRKDLGRNLTVATTTAGILLSILALLGVLVYVNAGTLTLESIRSSIEYVREGVVALLCRMRDEGLAELEAQIALQPAEQQEALQKSLATLRDRLPDATLRETVEMAFHLLPALTVLLSMLAAFLSQSLLCRTYFAAGMKNVLTKDALYLTASLTGAILLEVSFLLQVITPQSLVGTVAANLFLVLTPLFFLFGLQHLRESFAAMPGGNRLFWLLLAGTMLCCNPLVILYLIALITASRRILTALRDHLKNKLDRLTGDGPDED